MITEPRIRGGTTYEWKSGCKNSRFAPGFVRILAAEQTPASNDWLQGSAAAVRQSIRHFMSDEPEIVVVLSGEQLYRMDFSKVLVELLGGGSLFKIQFS